MPTSHPRDVQVLLARLLTLPVPTVAAVNGHAFGAGAMLGHGARLPGDAVRSRLPVLPRGGHQHPPHPRDGRTAPGQTGPAATIASMTTGRRFDGPTAVEFGLVDRVAEEPALLATATAAVRPLAGKDREHEVHDVHRPGGGLARRGPGHPRDLTHRPPISARLARTTGSWQWAGHPFPGFLGPALGRAGHAAAPWSWLVAAICGVGLWLRSVVLARGCVPWSWLVAALRALTCGPDVARHVKVDRCAKTSPRPAPRGPRRGPIHPGGSWSCD